MQLSFSVPSDSTVSPLLTGVVPDPTVSATDPAAGTPDGFAQLLAGLGSSSPANCGSVPAAANAVLGAPVNGVPLNVMPGLSPLLVPTGAGSPIAASTLGGGLTTVLEAQPVAPTESTLTAGAATGVIDVGTLDTPVAACVPNKSAINPPAPAKKPVADDASLQALVCAMSLAPVQPVEVSPTTETPDASNGEPTLAAGTLYRGIDLVTPQPIARTTGIVAPAEPAASEDSGSDFGETSLEGSPDATATASIARAAVKFDGRPSVPAVSTDSPKLVTPTLPASAPLSSFGRVELPNEPAQSFAAVDPTLAATANPTDSADAATNAISTVGLDGTPTPTASAVDVRPVAKANAGRENKIAVTSYADAAEKFAGNLDAISARSKASLRQLTKSFLEASDKDVTKSEQSFGITVANPTATMPAGSTLARSNTSEPAAVLAATPSAEARAEASSLPPPVALTSTAHRAVEAVLDVTERFAGREQHAVNLQFSVAGADLKVRVELRAGEVHTTFRTDSAELRTALSNEWQSVATQPSADRSTRIAPPVFTSNDSGNNAFSGDSASRQRDPHQSRTGSESFTSAAMPRRGGSTSDIGASAVPTAARTTAGNSVHLHTLA